MSLFFGAYGHDALQHLSLAAREKLLGESVFSSRDGLLHIEAFADRFNDVVHGKNVLLLGKVFDRIHYKPLMSLNASLTPHALVNGPWGRYIAAFYNESLKALSLVRDPMGLSTLFYMPTKDGVIFSTELSVLYDALEVKPDYDWMYFAEYMYEHHFTTTRTPFVGIFEVMSGISLTVKSDGSCNEHFEWDIPLPTVRNPEVIEEEIFQTFKGSVRAWLHNEKEITAELSGGVDSSSVVTMIKHCMPDIAIRAIHYSDSVEKSSQEESYALSIAEDQGLKLEMIDQHGMLIMQPLSSDWRPSKPSVFLTFRGASDELRRRAGDTIITSGQGGDHVFISALPKTSIADYWLDNGFKGIVPAMHEVSSLYRTSWKSLVVPNVQALVRYYRGISHREVPKQSPITDELAEKIRNSPFYIDNVLKKFSPTKAEHIRILWHGNMQSDRDQRFQDSVVVHPLMSLPLVEAALKIPTYQTCKNGYNRYYLRKATSRLTSSQVIWRRNKGHVTTSVLKSFIAEMDEILNLLNNGLMLKSGIIDVKWYEESLNEVRHGKINNLMLLMRLINAELWLKQWRKNEDA